MEIDAGKRTLGEVIRSGQHIIPRFQRPYAWTKQNVDELLSDIVSKKQDSLFLGSMVVARISDEKWEVIDGQQRLTTASICLSAIRDMYEELGNENRAKGIKGYLEFTDRNGENALRIKHENSHEMDRFDEIVSPRATVKPAHCANNVFYTAFSAVKDFIDGEMGKFEDPVECLDFLRDGLISSDVIHVRVSDRTGAFVIFETLNDRGLSLTELDLVKNLLVSSIEPQAWQTEEHKWNTAIETVKLSDFGNLDPRAALLYFWNSRASDPSTTMIESSKLRRSVENYLKTQASQEGAAIEIVEDFEHCSKTLGRIAQTPDAGPSAWTDYPGFRRDRFDDICLPLSAISITQALQPLPALMAAFRADSRAEKSARILNKDLICLLRYIEIFQFRWSISRSASTSTQRNIYRRLASQLDATPSRAQFKEPIEAFRIAALNAVPSDNQFKEGINKLIYNNSVSKDRHKIRYILSRVERHWGNTRIDFGRQPSIEHIQSQEGKSQATRRNTWIWKIGNMLLLPPDVNHRLKNSFAEKAPLLAEYANPSDIALHQAIENGQWTVSESRSRAELIQNACTEIWPLSELEE